MTTKKVSRRAGVRSGASATTGSTAARRRVTRSTKSERQPTPRTAYDLCEMVAQHIEEEPLRYDQGVWGWENVRRSKMPACGTVCCRAGWIVALHDGPKALQSGSVAERSNDILGLTTEETSAIYYDKSVEIAKQGTKTYARLGAAGLRAWAKQHAAHLKARLLKDVPKLGA